MAVDAILNIYINVTSGMVVYENVIKKRVMEKLPFMATENIMMESVKRGGDRQQLHEIIRVYSHEAAANVKLEGKRNDLIDKIAADDRIPLTKEEILSELDPVKYIGRCVSQTEEFVSNVIEPILKKYSTDEVKVELNV